MSNPYEDAARKEKVIALALTLDRWGIDAEAASKLSWLGWRAAAVEAGIRPPSVVTQELVVEALARPKPKPLADPFAGLPTGTSPWDRG